MTAILHRSAHLRGPRRHAAALLVSVAGILAVTLVIALLEPYAPVISLAILYMFAVLPVALAFGLAYSAVVSVASMLTFNWFFLSPVHSFTLADSRNWSVLAVFLVTAVVVSLQAARSRARAVAAEQREAETAAIARLATSLLQGGSLASKLAEVSRDSARVFGADSARIELGAPHPAAAGESPLGLAVEGRPVGTIYLDDRAEPGLATRRRYLPALASLLAVAIDREQLADQAVEADTLRRSDSIKTAVLRAVSHDLRSPLTAIQMAVGGLTSHEYELGERDRRELLDTIAVETERLTRLISNLLDLSRLQAGAALPEAELWPPDALVAQAITALGHRADGVRVQLPADLAPVRVDPIHAQRVLVNLIENAIRYSDSGEPVTVRGTSTRRDVILRVVDHGAGIPASELERIFEPFSAVDDGHSGAGLGLAIARGFAEANGGRVWAESQPGQGASFAFALPIADA